jgi:hypothetical protein
MVPPEMMALAGCRHVHNHLTRPRRRFCRRVRQARADNKFCAISSKSADGHVSVGLTAVDRQSAEGN